MNHQLIEAADMFTGNGILPSQLFAGGELGAWYNANDLSTLFQDTAGATPVTASGQSVARIRDISPNGNHINQATVANRPTYLGGTNTLGAPNSAGAGRLRHDYLNDALIWPGATGTYTVAYHNVSGVFFTERDFTINVTRLPLYVDFFSMVLINRVLTADEQRRVAVAFYRRARETTVPGSYRFDSRGTSYTGRGGTATGAVRWAFGSGAVYTTMFATAQAVTAPEIVDFTVANTALTQFICNINSLTGSIPSLTANTALTLFYCNNNSLTGSIPSLTANTALTLFLCYSNNLTGSIPSLTANTALTQFHCYGNSLTGSIPSLTANTVLTQFLCHVNSLTGSIPSLTANTALTLFYCHINSLTGSIPSLTANTALTQFNCYSNSLTGGIPSLTANTALTQFICNNNSLTGSIPSLTANTALTQFLCHVNSLTGSIPSLTANTALTQFSCYSNSLTGSIPSLAANTALTLFHCHSNSLTGSIPSLTANTALTQFLCNGNSLTGSIPSLTANTALTQFNCSTNSLTGFAGGTVSATLGDFNASVNDLPVADINAILAAFVAANRVAGTRVLNLSGGTNAAPTGQGITDKATLVTRGWTVTTN